jgi:hypothetical protein
MGNTQYIFFYFIHITLCFIHFGVIEKKFNILNTYFFSLSCIAFQLRQDSVVVYETLHKRFSYYLYISIPSFYSVLIYKTSHWKDQRNRKKKKNISALLATATGMFYYYFNMLFTLLARCVTQGNIAQCLKVSKYSLMFVFGNLSSP